MTWPLSWQPGMSRPERWTLLALAAFFWLNLVLPAPPGLYTPARWVGDVALFLPGDADYLWSSVSGGDWMITWFLLRVYWQGYGIALTLLVLVAQPGMLWLHAAVRVYMWDVLGAVCLFGGVILAVNYTNTDGFLRNMKVSLPHLWHFQAVLIANVAAALVYGHFGSILFQRRAAVREAPLA